MLLAAEPSRFSKDAAPCADPIFHKFRTEGRRRDGVGVLITDDWYPAQDDLSVAFSRGSATIRAERAEKNIIVFGNHV
jgi:hypothetical protein